jgi:uncharacterized SAM-binding protein YcdF (DUF218 family)
MLRATRPKMELLKALVTPPLALFAVMAAGGLLWKKRPKLARALLANALAVLVLLCVPLVAAALLRSLQSEPPLTLPPDPSAAQAIVVLAGDANPSAPELGGETVGPMTLERLRYGAFLARSTSLPVLVSGGPPRKNRRSHAESMREALERDFGVPVRWTEARSGTTAQNAQRSAEILRAAGVERVYLVTHAWHMPRARAAFERAGLAVVPAPTGFRAPSELEWSAFAPSAKALRESSWAVHEWIGRLWYWLAA